MAPTESTSRPRVSEVIEKYGKCLELIPADPYFHSITVGMYVKDGICTLWSFSSEPGTQDRLKEIRDQLFVLGGLAPVEATHNQMKFPCGNPHVRLLKFLLAQAVGKAPGYTPNEGLSIKDFRTNLTLSVTGAAGDGRWIYQILAEGDAPNIAARLRSVTVGFVRYGEMDKIHDATVSFPCGERHDELIRVLLPYSRNVSAVESMMDEEALRGQMTTGTLGFTPT